MFLRCATERPQGVLQTLSQGDEAGDTWLDKATNLLLFGPPGTGKSHAASAVGRALVENGYRVLFTRTTEIVQKLQAARQALQLEAAIGKLDKYHLLVLDDLSYVHKDHAETSVLFELIGARYVTGSNKQNPCQRQSAATIIPSSVVADFILIDALSIQIVALQGHLGQAVWSLDRPRHWAIRRKFSWHAHRQ